MRKVYFLLFVMLYSFGCYAQEDTEKLLPSGTLPILYINTVDETPVDQREYYIEATAWLDASMTDEFESLGSPDEPLALGIRGRGNATWSQSNQKPYKLKFARKQSIMGFDKSKHFALLHLRGAPIAYFNEPLAFHAARLLGDAWVPSCKPCEVVLNGDYMGLYFLTETVRVEDSRVNISKQPDLSVDKEMIDSGWLVEIDNNIDEYQTTLYETNGQRMLLTFKSPELLSQEQLAFIEREFTDIINCVGSIVDGNEDWLNHIDVHSAARHYILNEIMQNYDGFAGSFFLYRDKGTKWIVGPAWDYGSCLFYDGVNSSWLKRYSYDRGPHLIREMLNSPEMRRIILEKWESFYAMGTDWVNEVANDWADRIAVAGDCSNRLWGASADMYWRRSVVVNRLKNNIKWFNEYVHSKDFNGWRYGLSSDIKGLEVDVESNDNFYDLMGRKVRSPRKGIYISEGRKFIARGQ